MKMEWESDQIEGKMTFRGEVSDHELFLLRKRLDPIDKRLLDEGADNAADMLLILEMLFRRNAEQAEAPHD